MRELFNLVERAVILCRGDEITPAVLPPELAGTTKGKAPSRETLFQVLREHGGNRTRAARALGVNRTTLWRWMKRTGVAP